MKNTTTEGSINVTANPAYGASGNNTSVTVAVTPKRMAWAAVFAGALLALVAQLLLSMLGTAIGMSIVDPLQPEGTPTAQAMGVGAGLWWVISSFLALMFGGWVAGKLSGSRWMFDGAFHGLLVFAFVTLIGTYFIGSALTNLVQGGASMVGNGANAALSSMMNDGEQKGTQSTQKNQNVGAPQSGGLWDEIKRDAQSLFSNAESLVGKDAPKSSANADGSGQQDFDAILGRFIDGRGNNASDANRETLITLLMARTDMTRQQAEARVAGWENTIRSRSQQIEREAREAADKAASVLSKTALWGFITLLLGALGAILGGAAGISNLFTASNSHSNPKPIPATAFK